MWPVLGRARGEGAAGTAVWSPQRGGRRASQGLAARLLLVMASRELELGHGGQGECPAGPAGQCFVRNGPGLGAAASQQRLPRNGSRTEQTPTPLCTHPFSQNHACCADRPLETHLHRTENDLPCPSVLTDILGVHFCLQAFIETHHCSHPES